MNWIADRARNGELLGGTWLNLGSSLTAEIASRSGLDWVCIDLEHGAGDFSQLVSQLQAVSGTPASPIVRIASHSATQMKRVLDLGPAGVMVPSVSTVSEAEQIVSAMRYPPDGIRGVATMNRAAGFGANFDEYFTKANSELMLLAQIETQQGVDQAAQIASVDGVDALFVGPLDLSVNLSIPQQYTHPAFVSALHHVVNACRKSEKVAGILAPSLSAVPQFIADGFTIVAAASDGSLVQKGMNELASLFRTCKH